MSPEQASGRAVTPASDLWSLGATLYALVEGRPPFTGPNTAAVTAAILTQEPDPPRRAGSLAGVLAGLLVKDPARRMTTDQAAAGLAAVAAAHPAAAHPGAGHPAADHPGQGAGPQPTVPPGFLGTMRDAFHGRPVPAAVMPRRRTSRTAWVVAAAIVVVLAVAGYFIVDAVRGSGNHARLTRLAASIGSPPGFTREGSHDEAGGKLRLDYTRHCSNCKPTVLHDVLRWLATQPGVQQVAAPANDCPAPAGCGWQWSRDGAHVEVGFVTVSDEAYSLRVTLK
jgi:hypothetical protein